MKRIEMIINGDKVFFDFSGFQGEECKLEFQRIVAMLSIAGFKSMAIEEENKSEYQMQEEQNYEMQRE